MTNFKLSLGFCLLSALLFLPGCAEQGNSVNEAPEIDESPMMDLSKDLESSMEMKPDAEEQPSE